MKGSLRIAYSTNEELLVYNSWQECEGIGWFVRSVWFFWLSETNHMNQISQETTRDKPEDGYVFRLSRSARWAKGVKVEGCSGSRPGVASPDASAT